MTYLTKQLSPTAMCKDGIICDDVGCRSGLNKGGDTIYDVDITIVIIIV